MNIKERTRMTLAQAEMLSNRELADLNERFESADPAEILTWVDATFGDRAAHVSSFGLEGMALYDMFWKVNPKARVITLDTLRLPTETYSLFDRFQMRYGVQIETIYPDLDAVRAMIREKGFNLFYRGIQNRKECCRIRKVEPLSAALSTVDAWMTGLRRDQGMEREKISIVEWSEAHKNYKVNPLANWTLEQCKEYVEQNSVPYNELHDRGFPSIGCAPCTRSVQPGEDIRAGRWWWETDSDAKECGIHISGVHQH